MRSARAPRAVLVLQPSARRLPSPRDERPPRGSRRSRRAAGRAAVARRRSRRRHDAAREAALEARSRQRSTLSRAGCPRVSRSSRPRTARRRPPPWRHRSSAPQHRLAWNARARISLSGIASALARGRGAELGLFEVDEGALPEAMRRIRPRAVSLGEPVPRPARPLRRARARSGALARRSARTPRTTTLVVNADDPLVAELARRA